PRLLSPYRLLRAGRWRHPRGRQQPLRELGHSPGHNRDRRPAPRHRRAAPSRPQLGDQAVGHHHEPPVGGGHTWAGAVVRTDDVARGRRLPAAWGYIVRDREPEAADDVDVVLAMEPDGITYRSGTATWILA